jgi:hypothetical protein
MTVRLSDRVIVLEGDCPVDEAEALLDLLLANPNAPVDWTACGQLHSSLVQVLLAARPAILGVPENPFLRTWIVPMVQDS